MTPDPPTRWHRLREIFSLVSETPLAERAVLLDRLCEGDVELRREAEELLALRDEKDLALDRSAPVEHPSLGLLPRYETGDLLAGRYRITAFLASGGMGEVYAAVDVEMDRKVALKCIRNFGDLAGQAEARLVREVKIASGIQHRNVCRIYALEDHGGDRLCVMELLEGETLAERLAAQGRFIPGEALPILLQILDGLEAAHRASILHRDLKPANIMLSGERAVIIDFGLAAAIHCDTTVSLTAAGALIGTLAYIAPEQLEGLRCTPASDLYSLGVILYEMLTGLKPHDADSPFQLAAQKAREAHLTPAFEAYCLPAVWREAIIRCLRAKPEERIRCATELRELLQSGRPSLGFQLQRWKYRLMFPAAAVFAALFAWLGWTWTQKDHAPPPDATRLYMQAQSAMNAAAPFRATMLLERAVEIDSSFVKARSALAAVYADLDQQDKARDAVLQATAAADVRWVLGRGERYALAAARAVVMSDYKVAAERYGRMAASLRGAERSQTLVARGRMLEQAGQVDKAGAIFETVLREDPANGPARVRLALLLCRKRDFTRAEAEFHRGELSYEKAGNLEGLSDLLLARFSALRSRNPQQGRRDIERVLEFSQKTGNRYHALSAKLQMAIVAESDRDYDRAVEVAREAAQQATRDGMPAVAAQAMGELGYAFLYAKRRDEGVTLLRESVDMAQRARDPVTLARNRLRLGEALYGVRQLKEAVEVMEPAVTWYKRNASESLMPLIFIKWGTVLNATPRFSEAAKAFREALDTATRHGDESYQLMALQRLAGFYDTRDLRESAQYYDRMIVLARKTHASLPYLQAAAAFEAMGWFERAVDLIAEGEHEIAAQFGPGIDRESFTNYALARRVTLEYYQGHCAEGLRIASRLKVTDPLDEILLWRLRACAGGFNFTSLQRQRRSYEAQLARVRADDPIRMTRLAAGAGELALHCGDWRSAKRYAEHGLEAASTGGHFVYVLEHLLILRAAQRDSGNAAAVDQLTARVLQIATQIGFDPPKRFGGRQDLLRLWSPVRRLSVY